MSDNLYDDGIIGEWSIKGERLTFKLGDVTYGCFGEAKSEAQEILVSKDANKKVSITYYDKEKEGKTYHNVTKVEVAKNQEVKEEAVETREYIGPKPIIPLPHDLGKTILRQCLLKVAARAIAGRENLNAKHVVDFAKELEKEFNSWDD